jgi:serine/threonine protein kinase
MEPERPDIGEQGERLYAVILDFLESAERGGLPDQATLLEHHPELAPQLQEFLDTWAQVEGLTEPIRSASQALQASAQSAQLPASGNDPPPNAAMPAAAEPSDVGKPDCNSGDPLCKDSRDEAGWLARWLRQHPPLVAEQYPFLNVSQPQAEIGRLGPYRLLEVIGSGGMGIVFRAEDVTLRRAVAVKVMRAELAADPDSRERFLREARAAAALSHDNVIAVYHVGEESGVPYLGMQWLRGMSLEELLRRAGRLEFPVVLRLGRQIAQGLAAAHGQGLLHRDIKPANLWVELPEAAAHVPGAAPNAASAGRVKILDFGLARAASDEGQITRSGATVGTPAYMAPEQAAGGKVDARGDLYGLGVVLYRMCTGRLPFPAQRPAAGVVSPAAEPPPSVRHLNPAVPSALSDLVMELLARDPAHRPASAAEVADRLRALEPVIDLWSAAR